MRTNWELNEEEYFNALFSHISQEKDTVDFLNVDNDLPENELINLNNTDTDNK